MAVVTIRNLPDATHRALKVRAAKHGRSTEAEIRAILQEAVQPSQRLKIGSELAALQHRFAELVNKISRDQSPTEPASFE
jgi:plasmid stability protein